MLEIVVFGPGVSFATFRRLVLVLIKILNCFSQSHANLSSKRKTVVQSSYYTRQLKLKNNVVTSNSYSYRIGYTQYNKHRRSDTRKLQETAFANNDDLQGMRRDLHRLYSPLFVSGMSPSTNAESF